MNGGVNAADIAGECGPVVVANEAGRGPFVVLCDHASNRIPPEFRSLGLAEAHLERHIAWDPGALPVARLVAGALDAPLIHCTVSRLVIDVNRAPDVVDSIPETSEDTAVPGNCGLDPAARRRRIAAVYEPYHRAIDGMIERRDADGTASALIAVHTFTPVYLGVARPWHVGVLHGADMRLARPLHAALARDPGLVVGDNEPYRPADGVYHTLTRHGERLGLATAMIEIRNDLVASETGQAEWADRLVRALSALDLPARAA